MNNKFQNLGKATRRGIRKCDKCGVYNGTKSIACKNKECDMIFKDTSERRKTISDSVQLITGNMRKLYSVRVKDYGPNYRGFVQLPIIPHSLNSNESNGGFSEVALCFVDNCPRLFQDPSIHKSVYSASDSNLCPHINASLKSRISATPLPLKLNMILKLKTSVETQQNLCSILNESNVPVVQRVSKNVMSVKCKVTPKHPLGYLHFILNAVKAKDDGETYFCSCSETVRPLKCLHFYLCICALASDHRYIQEFNNFISLEFKDMQELLIVREDQPEESPRFNIRTALLPETKTYTQKIKTTMKKKNKMKKCTEKINNRIIWPKMYPIQINIPCQNDGIDANRESNPVWTFEDWLTFVVESMNKLIVFENAGVINTLIFNIPWIFYKTLRRKIPTEYLRSDVTTESILEYEIVQIMNISHLKLIFEKSTIKLKVSKRFILGQSSSYEEIDENSDSNGSLMPHFIYFLNVGQLTVDDSDNTNNPFTIEWILDSKNTFMGQLKLQYKYGRKCL